MTMTVSEGTSKARAVGGGAFTGLVTSGGGFAGIWGLVQHLSGDPTLLETALLSGGAGLVVGLVLRSPQQAAKIVRQVQQMFPDHPRAQSRSDIL